MKKYRCYMNMWIAAGIVIVAILGFMSLKHSDSNNKILRLALTAHWRTLHPGLQHTLVGDLVLSNQFDALVGMDSKGIPIPLGAKSWTINDDFTTFEFKIDQTKRFSDGSYLTAWNYKKAWESSAALNPKSSNNSLLDVLYKIDGYEDFISSGTISGIKVLNDDTLVVHFKSPFRMALDHLVGNRFAAHKEGPNGTYLGTGNYVISETNANLLLLKPNKFGSVSAKNDVSIEYLEWTKVFEKLLNGEIDGIPYIPGNSINMSLLKNDSIQIVQGQDALHHSLDLNRMPGRFFSNFCYRQAFQKKMLNLFKQISDPSGGALFSFDTQIYLPGQSGRLGEDELEDTIKKNKSCDEDFMRANLQHPLKVITSQSGAAALEAIKNSGIVLSKDSGVVDFHELIENSYKTSNADVVVASFSIANGDPDGIYHRLGKNGAILSPMIFSESVGFLLEEGRKIVDMNKLDSHYKNVAKEVIKDVPFVHLGFSKAVAVIRRDRLQFNSLTLRRNEGHVDVFELK